MRASGIHGDTGNVLLTNELARYGVAIRHKVARPPSVLGVIVSKPRPRTVVTPRQNTLQAAANLVHSCRRFKEFRHNKKEGDVFREEIVM